MVLGAADQSLPLSRSSKPLQLDAALAPAAGSISWPVQASEVSMLWRFGRLALPSNLSDHTFSGQGRRAG